MPHNNVQACVFKCYILSTFQIDEAFWKVIMYNDVTGCAFSYQIELNISKSKIVQKFYQRCYIMILTDLSNVIKKLWE